jgi:hypothetical protein
MKTLAQKLLFLTLCLTVLAPIFSQTINVSTGIDNLGNSISVGAIDPNWVISAGPGGPTTRRIASYSGYWQATPIAITNAGWINYTGTTNDPVGIKTFDRDFVIPSGTASFSTNFGVAWDDVLVSLELVPPSGGGPNIPLTVPVAPWYQLGANINYTVDCPKDGTWKIRAKVNFIDQLGAFILSGYINKVPGIQICNCDDLVPTFTVSTNANCLSTLTAGPLQSFFYSPTYSWKVNGSPVGTGQTLNYTFPGNGVYVVCLTVTATLLDGTVCTKEVCQEIVIQCQPCSCDQLVVDFDSQVNQCMGNFNALVNLPACMTNVHFEWTVDGVPMASGPAFNYTFPSNGSYMVCLKVSGTMPDGSICEKEKCLPFDIVDCQELPCNCDALQSNFTSLIDLCKGVFNSTSTIPPCMNGVTYQWFVNGAPAGTSPTLNYTFPGNGIYLICLTVNGILPDGTFCESKFCKEVNVKKCLQKNGLGDNSTNTETLSEETVLLYPNPATSEINLDFYLDQSSPVTVTLYSMDGKELAKEVRNSEAGNQHFIIQLPASVTDEFIFVEITTGETKTRLKASISKR